MDLQQIMDTINTIGFPIALAAFLLLYVKSFTGRMMDENLEREKEYRAHQKTMTSEMSVISDTLSRVNKSLDDARIEHQRIFEEHKEQNQFLKN